MRRTLLAVGALLGACDPRASDVPKAGAQASPNASIEPTQLASANASANARAADSGRGSDAGRVAPDSSARWWLGDAGVPPEPRAWTFEQRLERDGLAQKELSPLGFVARLVWPELPPSVELSRDRLKAVLERGERNLDVTLSPVGRLRVELGRAGLPFTRGAELRARHDAWGHLLVWDDATSFRVLELGALRSFWLERRADVGPLVNPTVKRSAGRNALGFVTERAEVELGLGRLVLDQARVTGSGLGAELWCRLLVELAGVSPETPACDAELLPLAAEFHWRSGGRLDVIVERLGRRGDALQTSLLAPPPGANQVESLPPAGERVLLSVDEQASLRTRATRGDPSPNPGAPRSGLVAVNGPDLVRWAVIDGVSLGWMLPREELAFPGLKPARYSLAWVDPLGGGTHDAQPVEAPARAVFGALARGRADQSGSGAP